MPVRSTLGGVRRAALALAAVLALPVALAAPASATAVSPGVLSPTSSWYGASYSAWSARWWQWAYQTPVHGPQGQTNLLVAPNGTDATPAPVDCSYAQSGSVWFLAGTFKSTVGRTNPTVFAANRSCTIPANVALFIPVINSEWDNTSANPSKPYTFSTSQLQQMVKADMDTVSNMSASIDGLPVQGLSSLNTAYRVQAGPFFYTLPGGNILGIPAQTTPPPGGYADGVFLMLAPLAVGTHTLHWSAAAAPPEFGAFDQDISYTVTVVPAS